MKKPKEIPIIPPYELAKQRIQWLKNQSSSRFNFGTLRTYRDFLLLVGHTNRELEYAQIANLEKPLTREWLRSLLDSQAWRVEAEERARHWTLPDQGISLADECLGEYAPRVEAFLELVPLEKSKKQEDKEQEPDNNIEIPKPSDTIPELRTIGICPSWTPDRLHPKQKAKLWKKQELAASQIYDGIVEQNHKGILLNAATGAGKTFILGAILRRLIDNKWKPLTECISPWPIVYVTKASIVEQTQRVLKNLFGIDTVNEVVVLNIEQLRASFGDMFIRWETLIENGDEFIRPIWKKNIHPILFLWDECHILKNLDSQQSLIAQDVNNIKDRYAKDVYQVFASATAGTRVIEFKCFAVATHASISDRHSISGRIELTNRNWTSFAKNIAEPADPEEHSPAAIERLITILLPYIVDVKGLRPQFHPHNTVEIIDFERAEERKMYDDAWEDYLKKKAELEASELLSGAQSRMMILAQFTIFRKTAEFIKTPTIVRRMYRDVQEGYAAIAACSFKGFIARSVKILMDEYHVPRSKISIIWGGMGQKQSKRKKKVSEKEVMSEEEKNRLIHNMVLAGASMDEIQELIDMQEDASGVNTPRVDTSKGPANPQFTKEELEYYGLGPQSKIQRQDEIDKIQSGQAHYCFFTFKAGGVGLSLHHTDEHHPGKVRKHANGDWVIEEDIGLIPTRPRSVYLTPVFSAIELVQGLGRAPRLTSLSDTIQRLIFYKNTIEERVANTVSTKLKCLKKVVRNKESWEQVILNPDKLTEEIKEVPRDVDQAPKQLTDTQKDDPDEDVFLGSEEDE